MVWLSAFKCDTYAIMFKAKYWKWVHFKQQQKALVNIVKVNYLLFLQHLFFSINGSTDKNEKEYS